MRFKALVVPTALVLQVAWVVKTALVAFSALVTKTALVALVEWVYATTALVVSRLKFTTLVPAWTLEKTRAFRALEDQNISFPLTTKAVQNLKQKF